MNKIFAIAGMLNYVFVVFLNAFTDLGHKIIVQNTIFKVYEGNLQIILTAIVNALILLPFIITFSPAGFLSDRFAKSKIMEYSALFAVLITLLITYAYYQGWFYTAFFMTFLLALQSALYAPAKYGYIKELVGVERISSGNGVVQATTTVAILGGIIFYSLFFEMLLGDSFASKEDVLQTVAPLGWLLVLGSLIEWMLARKLPNKMGYESLKRFDFTRYRSGLYLRKNLKTVMRKREVFEAVLALSLFWSISQVVLAIFGEYAKSELGVTNALMVQGVMALAGIGIVIGSILVARLSTFYIQTGFAAVGAFGITFIVFMIPLLDSMTVIAIMFMLFGFFAGFIMVPLNAYIQFLSPNVHLGTILAGNNFIQNIFMIAFLLLTTLFAFFGMNAEILFYCMGFVGVALFWLLLKRHFVMTFWALAQLLLSIRYRFVYHGLENLPHNGAILMLGNHVSWIDWAIIQFPIQRRLNYMMDKEIYNKKIFHHILKKGEIIPISPRAFKDGFKIAKERLVSGKIVVLFPEGEIAKTPQTAEFKRGYELIGSDYEGVLLPFYIDGINGSIFSRTKEKRGLFGKREVHLYIGRALPKDIDAATLYKEVTTLKERYETQQTQIFTL